MSANEIFTLFVVLIFLIPVFAIVFFIWKARKISNPKTHLIIGVIGILVVLYLIKILFLG